MSVQSVVSGNVIADEAKCQGCSKCVRACPVDANIVYDLDGKNKVRINYDRCIECGRCIRECQHGARSFVDDTEQFFADLERGERITLLAAPSIRVNFHHFTKLFGFLVSKGVEVVYDVSFGADITTWAYLKAINEKNLTSVIAQPCPAVVNYIEKIQPELISSLSSVHSPMLCMAIYVKKYLRDKNKLAMLSPCISKRSEFKNTGNIISYNVTYKKLDDYLREHQIDLQPYDEVEFSDIACSLGCLFSKPGGLRENVEAQVPDAWIKQVEGQEMAYEYLDIYQKRRDHRKPVPLLVDILNCQHGCNIGTASVVDDEILDDIDYKFNQMKRAKTLEEEKVPPGKPQRRIDWMKNYFDEHLDLSDFIRQYTIRKAPDLVDPNHSEYDTVFKSMLKFDHESREINCAACGYDSCKDMARAVFNGISIPQNCINYSKEMRNKQTTDMLQQIEALSNERLEQSKRLHAGVVHLTDQVGSLSQLGQEMTKAGQEQVQNAEMRLLPKVEDRVLSISPE